ncbi:unnamed protein product [Oncorhynchus mykiss]|uniref:Uncharacterized protein n=1 Tax=Oncorhynchus mykiss TaxID=8022 RepID=A0A060W1V4_ONCMY|nr:unnamed protein product [Oncorhynchus mykiss]
MATAPPQTAWLSRGWCGLHTASPGENYMPSRTPSGCHRKAKKIIKDNNHLNHCLFTPLPSRKRGQYRCIKAGTERLKNSLSLKAITNTERLLKSDLKSLAANKWIPCHFNNAYISCITHICIYCVLYHLLHFPYAALSFLIHIFICIYCYSISLLRFVCIR